MYQQNYRHMNYYAYAIGLRTSKVYILCQEFSDCDIRVETKSRHYKETQSTTDDFDVTVCTDVDS